MARLLFGPCDDPIFFDRFLKTPVDEGRWAVFNAACPSWNSAATQLKSGPPDALVVWPGSTSVPPWVWSVPVPVVAAAPDPDRTWSQLRHLLPLTDLILTDAPAAHRLRRAGLTHVRAANLFGLDRHFAAAIDAPESPRDIDVLVVGRIRPPVWAEQYRVAIAQAGSGSASQAQLRRSKLVFHRSTRGQCEALALEAAASGAVLLLEAENREVGEFLQPGVEYVPYTGDDCQAVVARLLGDHDERIALAEAAKDRVRWYTFDALVQVALVVGGKDWSEVKDRARPRARKPTQDAVAGSLEALQLPLAPAFLTESEPFPVEGFAPELPAPPTSAAAPTAPVESAVDGGPVTEPEPPPAPPVASHEVVEPIVVSTSPVQPAALAPAPRPTPPAPPARPRTRFADLTPEAFRARFGDPDTRAALSGFTPPQDTHAVLTLVAHVRPRRVLEIGTAAGHMTANLTAFTPEDAVVTSLGLVAEDGPQSGTPHQDYEIPKRHQFAAFLNHFGTAHKARLVAADSRAFDFAQLAPLDFAFVDGGHDLATARADSLAAYHALRPGGTLVWHDVPSSTPWVEVQRAIESLSFRESVYRVADTRVAFLVKGEGLGATASVESGVIAVNWDGAVDVAHSLAHVNRAVCTELVARGHRVALVPQPPGSVPAAPLPVPPELAALVGAQRPGAVHVRHRWPPDFTPPPGSGPLVLIQPWEYGRLPRAWVEPILAGVDEVWTYSRAVLRAYVASGVPEDRVALVPPGVDPDRFRPGLEPLPLPTAKRVKLLFVGGTIPRKGFDVLLAAYRRAFARTDDVCLVVKDVGVGTFYRDQTAGSAIAALRADPDAPEVLYLTADLSEDEMPRLFASCDALVHPYRGEGFGLPVLEAMACGLPVVVTAGGATDEFVPQSACWRIPARLRYFERESVGDLPTVGRPWWLEPDPDALIAILKEVATNAQERARRGVAARRAARGWTWARTASAVEDRVRVLRTRTPVRSRHRGSIPVPHSVPAPPATFPPPVAARAETLWAPAAFAPAVTLRPDEPLVVTAAPGTPPRATVPAVAGRPRVSLTMIVKDEQHNLPDCLASVRDLVDEAVVIDTGSTDRTVAIAKSFGCAVGSFPWVDHFARARNAALERATGDYAFWMDADDRLDDANRAKYKALVSALPSGNAAFVMKCLCVGDGAGGTAVDHVRLFRLHPAHRWTYRVHEQILPALRATGAEVAWSEVCVRHVGYVDPAVRRRKLDRDLRLLKLDAAEKPGDPFTLFNLGSVYHEVGDFSAAAEALEKSLAGSHPKDSIVRKTYALLARCRRQCGGGQAAQDVCGEGRGYYPDDAELLFLAAGYAREAGDLGAAEGLYRTLIDGSEGPHFASVDTGLRAVKARHNLAVLLLDQNRLGEAEGVWRAALTHDPQFLPAQVGLGEVYLKAKNGPGLDRQVAALEATGEAGASEGAVLAARWKSTRGDHPGAVAVLEEAIARLPRSLGVRVALSHTHIAADAPPEVLEPAFQSILALDPNNEQAKRNLEVLYRKTGRWIAGVHDGSSSTPPG